MCLKLASLVCCVLYLMCAFDSSGFCHDIDNVYASWWHYTNRYTSIASCVSMDTNSVKSGLTSFLQSSFWISILLSIIWDHTTYTPSPLFLTVYQPHPLRAVFTLEMAIEIYAKMLEHFQHMTWLNPKSQSYYCLQPFLHWRLGSHCLKSGPHMSNAVFVSLLAHSWMSSAGEYRSVLLPAHSWHAPSYLCNTVTD